jgi:DNA-binding NtrC family response regulator
MSAKKPLASVQLMGQNPAIVALRAWLSDLAQSPATVLITGETGTGKDVAARYLHSLGPEGPFVHVDCGALQQALLASELFGHERGAFTGAVTKKLGLFEIADQGTVFLDEIGELGLQEQKQLLTVLDTRQVRPLGSVQSRAVGFRVVAATNRDLHHEVREGRFREDLYYRLNVIKLRVPPLRERLDDLPLLVQHFLDGFGREQPLSDDAIRRLQSYAWPGNIRQLRSCIERMVTLAGTGNPTIAHMPDTIRVEVTGRSGDNGRVPLSSGAPKTADIATVLETTGHNISAAARTLGIGRSTLYRRLREFPCTQRNRNA